MNERLREKVEAAAKKNSVSMNSEMVSRLEKSFERQETANRLLNEIMELAFGEDLGEILLVLGTAMKLSGQSAGFVATGTLEGTDLWSHNAYAFSQASQAAAAVLDGMKPDGDPAPPRMTSAQAIALGGPPDPEINATYANLGRDIANVILVKTASDRTRASGTLERARLLLHSLGPLAQILRKFSAKE